MIVKIELAPYQVEWLEQAKAKEEMGKVVDDGTLLTLGQLFLEGYKE